MELFHYNFNIPQENVEYEQPTEYSVSELENTLVKLKKKIDHYYDANRKYNVWNVMSRDLHHYESVIVKSPFRCVSRAFFKLMEILVAFDIKLETDNTLHLCEAPGGFIQACLLLYGEQLKKFVTVSADSSIKYHKNIKNNSKGSIIIDDITSVEASDAIYSVSPDEGYGLITADGAFDVSDSYEDQENKSYDLLFNEITVALSCQKPGGCFIIKMFDCVLNKSWNLISWLRRCYKEIYICKPPSSRPVNSEKYCVCLNFLERRTYTPIWNTVEYNPFREYFLKKSLLFQIKKLEEVFYNIHLSEDPQTEKLNSAARQQRIKMAAEGEAKYLKIYGKYLNHHHQPPSFFPATAFQ